MESLGLWCKICKIVSAELLHYMQAHFARLRNLILGINTALSTAPGHAPGDHFISCHRHLALSAKACTLDFDLVSRRDKLC